MEKKEVLLLYIYLPVKEPNIVSPIQIMKGLFLASKELKLNNFYKFEPYLYGPCSFEVYQDINQLLTENLITMIKIFPSYWAYYKITPQGAQKSRKILQTMNRELLEKLKEIKELVVNKSFIELLKYVYEKYPEYSINSIIDVRAIK